MTSQPAEDIRRACHDWLLAACRQWLVNRAGVHGVCAPLLEAGVHWDRLGAMARHHGVEPLLHALVLQHPSGLAFVPRALRDAWERAYYGTRIHNSEALDALMAVTARCQEAGVPVRVLKGPAILASVYGDIGLRPMADLDLLCRPSDLLAVRDILTATGFDTVGTPYLYQVDFHRTDRNLTLELHFDVHRVHAQRPAFLHDVWLETATTSIEDWTFPVLSPEHQLVFELGHAAWHGFALDIRRLVDYAGRLLLAGATLDRLRLARILAQTGLTALHGQFVSALQDLLALPLDEGGVVAWSRSGAAETSPDTLKHALRQRSIAIGATHEPRTGSEFRRQRTFVARAAFVWRRLMPPRAALQAAYNLRSPGGSLLGIPIHVSRTVRDLWTRARAGY